MLLFSFSSHLLVVVPEDVVHYRNNRSLSSRTNIVPTKSARSFRCAKGINEEESVHSFSVGFLHSNVQCFLENSIDFWIFTFFQLFTYCLSISQVICVSGTCSFFKRSRGLCNNWSGTKNRESTLWLKTHKLTKYKTPHVSVSKSVQFCFALKCIRSKKKRGTKKKKSRCDRSDPSAAEWCLKQIRCIQDASLFKLVTCLLWRVFPSACHEWHFYLFSVAVCLLRRCGFCCRCCSLLTVSL